MTSSGGSFENFLARGETPAPDSRVVLPPEPGPPPAALESSEREEDHPRDYRALAPCAKGSEWNIDIHMRDGQFDSLAYSYVLSLPAGGDTEMSIVATGCTVSLLGQGLLEIRQRLLRREVRILREYDPRQWPTKPTGGPIIERIAINYRQPIA